jgi:hypothetical protein
MTYIHNPNNFDHLVFNAEARSASRTADSAKDKAIRIQDDLDAMLLKIQAMWEVISVKLDISDEELLAKVKEIDSRDGVMNGKAKPEPVICDSCSKPNSLKRRHCLFCGKELIKKKAF